MELRSVADRIDTSINWLKWPVAVASVLLLIPSLQQSFELLKSMASTPQPIIPFLGGAALYFTLWRLFIRFWRTTLLSTLEHELTHALFAILTLHRVVGLRTTWNQGGHVEYQGRGNWLITVAPYFFPTICFVQILLAALIPMLRSPVVDALIGAAFAYHVTSTLRETHPGQTDLQKSGFLFCFAFLPTANLLSNGLVLAYSFGGLNEAGKFLSGIQAAARALIH
jgi:hypothetical protein